MTWTLDVETDAVHYPFDVDAALSVKRGELGADDQLRLDKYAFVARDIINSRLWVKDTDHLAITVSDSADQFSLQVAKV